MATKMNLGITSVPLKKTSIFKYLKHLRLLGVMALFCCVIHKTNAQGCNCEVPNNLLFNADFSLGNQMFNSTLPFSMICDAESYGVGAEPRDKCPNPLWENDLWDHTQGDASGRFLIVDGHNTQARRLWSSEYPVNVNAGLTYKFAFWNVRGISDNSNRQFELRINGNVVETINTATVPVGELDWTEYCTFWEAPSSQNVYLELWQATPVNVGTNDYGIDDIYFGTCDTIDCEWGVFFTKTDLSCDSSTGSIDLTVEGGTPPYSFSWVGPGTFIDSTEDISGLMPGGYIVVVTDSNGCTFRDTIQINDSLQVGSVVITPVTCDSSNGTIDLTVIGGIPPYTYSWSGPNAFTANTQDITGLDSGTYTVTITDSNGCMVNDSFYVEWVPPVSFVLYVYHANCLSAGGSIDLEITSGTPPFTYSWTGPNSFTASTQDIDDLDSGIYNVTVTDSNGCVFSLSDTVLDSVVVIIYVDTLAMGANDGSDWQDAFRDLQDALAEARDGCGNEIWVSEGIYYPAPIDGREDNAFEMVPDVKIYGGFSTTGGDIEFLQRDWFANLTVLSGDLDRNSTLDAQNAYNVVRNYVNGLTNTALLDGFTVTMAYKPSTVSGLNGAIGNAISSPMIRNCHITGNYGYFGPGLYNLGCSTLVEVINCSFTENESFAPGAGAWNYTSNASYINCLFADNLTDWAGHGPAMYNYISANVTVTNCTFADNFTYGNKGGAINTEANSSTTIENSIIWGNIDQSTNGDIQLIKDGTSTVSITQSDIENSINGGVWNTTYGSDGGGNIDDDPEFLGSGNYHLSTSFGNFSQCIDHGSNLLVSVTTDLDNNPRIVNTTVDMGCYESDYTSPKRNAEDLILQETMAGDVVIFPNPGNNELNITLNGEAKTQTLVTLTGLDGRVLRNEQAVLNGSQKLTIDVSSLKPGVYIILITTEGKQMSKSWIKQ